MIKKLFTLLIIAICTTPLFAVTDKEMEEAKTITAQAYLRYANDGSGYLDDVKATTMSELESKLKAKEKENLQAFKSVKIPTDYASWDKARLVEFWSVTFFASPNLTAKGKVARTRVKNRVGAMKIADKPAAEPTPAKEDNKPAAATPAATETAAPAAAATEAEALAQQEEILEKQEEILADQNAMAKDEQERRPAKKSSNTWVYVIILIILIGVVVWLVVFAANMMKKQAEPLAGMNGDSKEFDRLQKQYNAAKETMEQYRSAFEEEQKETKRLRNEVKTLKEQIAVLQSAATQRPQKVQEQPQRRPAPAEEAPRREAPRQAAEQPAQRKISSEFYLGRVNNRGLFVRADREFNPGHSIYRLVTHDGLVGTFHVVDRPEVVDLVREHPVEYIGGGCSAIDIEDTTNLHNIITENAGTALFEGGAWKVTRRSRVRYE
ncbi:MAG: hypothetical protein K2K97_05505 [Muribaculaceae bacterium]|nr:hypothetical protein [Muribaculaceae bacterium]